jgi:Protein of unknown function (DUF1761)
VLEQEGSVTYAESEASLRGGRMTLDGLGDLNWLAVLVAALAYFVLGAIWYAPPVFGKAWMKAAGMEMPESGERPGAAIYIGPFFGGLIAALATALLAAATGTDTAAEGVVLGLVVGLGYAMSVTLSTAIFETHKPQKGVWFVITSLYHIVGLVIAAVIVALWN